MSSLDALVQTFCMIIIPLVSTHQSLARSLISYYFIRKKKTFRTCTRDAIGYSNYSKRLLVRIKKKRRPLDVTDE